jgi:hypothetical protein
MLHELYKGKGLHSQCSSYRDIHLSDDTAKTFGRIIRNFLQPDLAAYSVSTQWGSGLNGGDTAVAHLAVRTLLELGNAYGTTCGLLFMDLIAAFPSSLRRIVFDVEQGDEAWLKKLRCAGFSAIEIADIYHYVMESIWDQVGSNKCATALGAQMHNQTWCSTEGLPGVLATEQGTMPGAPLADLAFNAAMAKVLKVLRQKLQQEDLVTKFEVPSEVINFRPSVPLPAEILAHDVSYVDDAVLPVYGVPEIIESRISAVVVVAVDTFSSFAMSLNFTAGKTEVLIQWSGKNAVQAKRRLAVDRNNIIVCSQRRGPEVLLRAVDIYI